MLLTLTLATALIAGSEPQAEVQPKPQKGWIVEVSGYTDHRQVLPDEWVFELQGFTKHGEQPDTPKGLTIESVETQYYRDLSAYFTQFELQIQVEAVETSYVDDLPAFFNNLKQQMP